MLTVTHDETLDIAIGKSRKETNWKNKEMQWSELVNRLQTTHRTAETYTEYITAKKTRQDEIKDIGGFVGGFLSGGRRKSGSVVHRQLITLDLDFASKTFWEDMTMLYDYAAVMYSTHKHCSESPRLRLIMPLDRPVMQDEYQAITRRLAGTLGIELFDPTTFQPERLMYWPSTSKDGEYLFEFNDGPFISADEVLAEYTDWRDSSSWPVSEKIGHIIQRGMKQQGDPLEKPGIIGAFCRTYDIHQAIETYLTDQYDACDAEGRYTYKLGSTAAGLVTYDDKFAYSHHGTDPVSGKLCNAFDLVRIHLFGLKDEDAREGTPGNKLPSFIAMQTLGAKDPAVRKLLVSERNAEAAADFAGLVTEDEDDTEEVVSDEWKSKLDVDRKGNVYSTIDNIVLILENDPYFKNRFAYDDFEKCEVALKDLPWRKIDGSTRRLNNNDDANMRHYLERAYGISHSGKVKDAMEVVNTRHKFHPVKDYLQATQWDGIPRVDTLLIDYQGAEDTEYVRAVTRKWLTAAVARIFVPGIKFDSVLVLVGGQGLKKSSLFAQLGGKWFSDSFSTIKGKDAFEQLQGTWIVEMGELSALAKSDVESIKHFISKRDDRYRVAYGVRVETFPRQCVFVGSTNKLDFLKDTTGNRRFWPVAVRKQHQKLDVFEDLTPEVVSQLWAEAVHYFNKGERLYLTDSLLDMAAEVQLEHTEEHPWTGMITAYLDIKLPAKWLGMDKWERLAFLQDKDWQETSVNTRNRVCVLEIWDECLRRKETIDERSANIIRSILRTLPDWEEEVKPLRFGIYGVQRRGFLRKNGSDQEMELILEDLAKMT